MVSRSGELLTFEDISCRRWSQNQSIIKLFSDSLIFFPSSLLAFAHHVSSYELAEATQRNATDWIPSIRNRLYIERVRPEWRLLRSMRDDESFRAFRPTERPTSPRTLVAGSDGHCRLTVEIEERGQWINQVNLSLLGRKTPLPPFRYVARTVSERGYLVYCWCVKLGLPHHRLSTVGKNNICTVHFVGRWKRANIQFLVFMIIKWFVNSATFLLVIV